MNNSLFDVWVTAASGLIGYILSKHNWPVVPLILGSLLGPLTEQTLRQSLQMSRGDVAVFFGSSIAVAQMIVAFATFALMAWQRIKPALLVRKEVAFL